MGVLVRYKPSQKLCRTSTKILVSKDPTEIRCMELLKDAIASE